MRKIILLFAVFHTLLTFSQKTYYLEGTVAKSKIYMKIEIYDQDHSSVNATYFYQNSLKDIRLEGKLTNDNFILYFKPQDSILEKFYLNKSENNTFNGSWYNNTGKQFSVKLRPIDFSSYISTLNGYYADEKLNLVKAQFLEFNKTKTTTYNNKEFIWFSEKHCDSDFFRLGNNFSEKNKAVLNPILAKIHLENTLDQLNCSTSFEYNEGTGIETTTGIHFLNSDLIGFEVFSSYFCGGAHPDFGGNGYLIDLHNGKKYEIDNILAFDKSVTTEKESNFDNYSDYRNTYFAPKLLGIINSEFHFEKSKNDDDDMCDYTNVEYWKYPSWSYTEKGIEFTPSFYRAARACEDSFLVPFQKLKKYKNSKFPYNLEETKNPSTF